MTDLLARLEVAEAGCRLLDAELWDLIDNRPRHDLDGDGAIFKRYPDDDVAFDSPPRFTQSLDAALALAERLGLDVLAIMNEAVEGLAVGGWSSSLRTLVPELARHACIAILKAKGAEQ